MTQQPTPTPHPNPAVTDHGATIQQLHARAAHDYATNQAATAQHEAQGGTGQRDGILPAQDTH